MNVPIVEPLESNPNSSEIALEPVSATRRPTLAYFLKLVWLAIHAGIVWNVKPDFTLRGREASLNDWFDQIEGTPLKYEARALKAERKAMGLHLRRKG